MAVCTVQLIGLGLLGLGAILHIVGTATPGWMSDSFETNYENYRSLERGLFKICGYPDGCSTIDLDEAKSAHKAVVALSLIGIILSVYACVLGFVSFYWNARLPDLWNTPALASMLLCFVSGAAIIVAVIVYGVEIYKGKNKDYFDLDYSFGLCITGAPFIMAGGVLINCQGRKRKTLQPGEVLWVPQQPHLVQQPQAGRIVDQPDEEGMVYQPQTGGMMHQPQVGGMVHQQEERRMVRHMDENTLSTSSRGLEARPQAEEPEFQLQAGAVGHQTQAVAMVHREEPELELVFFDGSTEDRLQAEDNV